MDLGLAGALLGGILTLLSPCSVMLLPSFFAYAFTSAGRILARTGVFYLGLITTLVPMGLLAGTVGAFVGAHRTTFVTVASILVIAFGLVQLLGIPIPGLSRRDRTGEGDGSSPLSVYLLGTVYGLAGVCAGPVLGTVLTLAALGGSPLYGGLVLAVFALGMTLPLIVLALVWTRLERVRGWLRPREVRIGRWTSTWTEVVGGALMVAVGVLLLVTAGTASLGGLVPVDQQAQIEDAALRATAGIPDLVLVGAVVAIAAAVLVGTLLVARARRATARRSGGAS